MKIFILSWLLVGFVGALAMQAGLSSAEPLSPKKTVAERGVVKIGDAAPNFQLRDLAGNMVVLSQLRGKVVLLNFWATWCGPCRVEMPAMEQLYKTFPRKEFEILAVSTDPQGAAV